jgi:hypothetical protein
VFFFPQALRWYVEQYRRLPATASARDALRGDPVQRGLAVQAVILLASVAMILVLGASELGAEIDPFGVAFGVAFGVVFLAGIFRPELVGVALAPG